jgi:hypothetical protein
MRLGIGEYHSPRDPQDPAVWFARNRFLAGLRVTAPEVLRGLRDDVRGVYWPQVALTNSFSDPPDFAAIADLSQVNGEFCSQLRELLLDWATRFHLNSRWLLDTALRSLWRWEKYPAALRELSWESSTTELHRAALSDERFVLSALWNPLLESWEQFDRGVRARFELSLRQFRRDTEARCSASGLKPPQRSALAAALPKCTSSSLSAFSAKS